MVVTRLVCVTLWFAMVTASGVIAKIMIRMCTAHGSSQGDNNHVRLLSILLQSRSLHGGPHQRPVSPRPSFEEIPMARRTAVTMAPGVCFS